MLTEEKALELAKELTIAYMPKLMSAGIPPGKAAEKTADDLAGFTVHLARGLMRHWSDASSGESPAGSSPPYQAAP